MIKFSKNNEKSINTKKINNEYIKKESMDCKCIEDNEDRTNTKDIDIEGIKENIKNKEEIINNRDIDNICIKDERFINDEGIKENIKNKEEIINNRDIDNICIKDERFINDEGIKENIKSINNIDVKNICIEDEEFINYVSNKFNNAIMNNKNIENECINENIKSINNRDIENERIKDEEFMNNKCIKDKKTIIKDKGCIKYDIKNKDSINKFNYKIIRKPEIIKYREKLRIFYEEDKIIEIINNNKIIMIDGPTGCGKSTQIPQFLLENGYSNIIITQPRRISAMSISDRINKELGSFYVRDYNHNSSFNDKEECINKEEYIKDNKEECINEKYKYRKIKPVGYKIKYENNTNKDTKITVMTDGILLNEIKNDIKLKKYNIIIIDEVHERSINIDIILPILFKIINFREDLKIILMSATFNGFDELINAYLNYEVPKIKLKMKNYPVKVFYEDELFNLCENFGDDDEDFMHNIKNINMHDQTFKNINMHDNQCTNTNIGNINMHNQNITTHKNYLRLSYQKIIKILKSGEFKNILVFLATKNEIKVLKNALEKIKIKYPEIFKCKNDNKKFVKILPLHADLSRKQQKRIFKKDKKIILSTNVAENGITIPDISHVIDSGRVKKCIFEDDKLIYFIDYISKSSADQRMGRTGRTCEGICYRLYTGYIHSNMAEYNEPEIFTKPLDSVVLFIKSLGIKNLNNFKFLETPSTFQSENYLKKIKAINSKNKITKLGKFLSKFPINPKYSQILTIKNLNIHFYLIISILELKIEIKNEKYFLNQKSDLISKLNFLIDFLNSENKKLFCSSVKINYKKVKEIFMLAYQLKCIRDNYLCNEGNIKDDNICINNNKDIKKNDDIDGINNDECINNNKDIKKNYDMNSINNNDIKKNDDIYDDIDCINIKINSNDMKNIYKIFNIKFDSYELRKEIFKIFYENLCIKVKNDFLFKNQKIFIDKNSISLADNVNYFVFEYLIIRNNKLFAFNITVVDDEWVEFYEK